ASLESLAGSAEHLELLRRLEIGSWLSLPLEAPEETLGVLALAHCESGRRFSAEDLALAEDLARRAAVAIHNARLYSEVRRADRKKNEFLAMLAHELRNPLAAIRNAVEVLRLSAAGEEARSASLGIIRRQIAHQSRMVEDLMNVSRIAHGKLELHVEPLELVRLAGTVIEDQRQAFREAGLELKVDLRGEPLLVSGDPVRLSQVLVNLLHNAAKFTGRGGRVEVSVRRELGGSRARLAVRDTGEGIEGDLLAHVFEPFTQGEQGSGRSKGGLGLGLALVKGIVDLHGGEALIHSAGRGQGCEVTLLLPLAEEVQVPVQANAAPEAAASPGGAGPKPGSRRVLVVEDNRDAAVTLSWILESNGHRVRLAHSGSKALEAAREFHPEVVLCDLGLPGMDGCAVATALR